MMQFASGTPDHGPGSSPATEPNAATTPPVNYRVMHRTVYRYSAPVAVCQNQLRMRPRRLPSVRVNRSDTTILPRPDTRENHVDYFGNEVETFAIEALHDKLVVSVESDVTVTPLTIGQPDRAILWRDVVERLQRPVTDHLAGEDLLKVGEFVFASPRISWDDTFRQYAMASFDKHETLVDAAVDLTRRIYTDFKYDSVATHVDTLVDQAFALKAGVCQDFAQVQIACLRSLGLAARYVSGYLRTLPPPGKPKLVGADESHAWSSVYLGGQHGWLDLDPTNGCVTGRDHIPICFGRDYKDVSPMRGVAIGGGKAELKVSVDVAEV